MSDGHSGLFPGRWSRPIGLAGTSFLLSLGMWHWGGGTVAAPFGLVTILTVVLVPVLGVAGRMRDVVTAIVGASLGVGAGLSLEQGLGWRGVLACVEILASLLVAQAGVVRLVMRAGATSTLANAVGVAATLSWLTWPLWLTGAPQGAVNVHPLLALNGVLPGIGNWTELPIAYRLTTLGQDVPYTLPTSAWPSVAIHLLVGAAAAAIAGRSPGGRIASRSTSQIEAAASDPNVT